METEKESLNLFGLSVSDKFKSLLRTIRICAIIIIICMLAGVLLNLYDYLKAELQFVSEANRFLIRATRIERLVNLGLLLLVNIILTVFLWKFARFTGNGLANNDSSELGRGFIGLKNYFLVYGIMLIIFCLLLTLVLVLIGSYGM